MHIQRTISRVLAAAVASSGFVVAPMPLHATTLSCSSFSATPDGSGNITVNCTDAGSSATCTVSASPTSVPASGGQVTITTNCGTGTSVTGGKSLISRTTNTWVDSIPATTSTTQQTFTYAVAGSGGSTSASVVQAAASGGGGGGTPPPQPTGSITCPGYANTITLDLAWGTPASGNPRVSSSGFGNTSIVVARFTTPANLPTGVGGAIKMGEWASATTMRSAAISTSPCDFPKPNPMGRSGTQTSPNNPQPTIYYQVGAGSSYTVGLQPSTTYYVSIINAYTSSTGSVVPTCSASGCNVFVELDKPAGF